MPTYRTQGKRSLNFLSAGADVVDAVAAVFGVLAERDRPADAPHEALDR